MVKPVHSSCTPSLWGDSSGPHRFSHAHSRGLSKKKKIERSSLLPQSFKGETAGLPSQTLWLRRHTRGLCSKFRDINKTNGRRRSDDLLLQSAPPSPPKFEFHSDNEKAPQLQLRCWPSDVSTTGGLRRNPHSAGSLRVRAPLQFWGWRAGTGHSDCQSQTEPSLVFH